MNKAKAAHNRNPKEDRERVKTLAHRIARRLKAGATIDQIPKPHGTPTAQWDEAVALAKEGR